MNLDLNELLGSWTCCPDNVCARVVRGENGEEVLQLRVDLGLLQMSLDGRPDGRRYRGLPSVGDYFEHERRVGNDLTEEDWRELHRELQQHNYRRLAFSSLAEESLGDSDSGQGRACLQRALRDIEYCLATLHRLDERKEEQWDTALTALLPTLVFNRARLLTRLRAAEDRYDEAIEEAEFGIRDRGQILAEAGFEQQREENPAIAYLRQMGQRLREQHGIAMTLRERLDNAIEREDFEAAARLRDELHGRRRDDLPPKLPAPEET